MATNLLGGKVGVSHLLGGKVGVFPKEKGRQSERATTLSPALDETILAELESLREQLSQVRRDSQSTKGFGWESRGLRSKGRQSALTPKLDSAADDWLAHAATLRTIAGALVKWYEQVVVSQSPMDDAMRAELALVSRRELVDAAIQNDWRDTFREISARWCLRMFSFSSGLEELLVHVADTAADSGDQEAETQPAALESSASMTDTSATALGDALASALARSAGEPVSTVVALTNGANNTGSELLAAARKLTARHAW